MGRSQTGRLALRAAVMAATGGGMSLAYNSSSIFGKERGDAVSVRHKMEAAGWKVPDRASQEVCK